MQSTEGQLVYAVGDIHGRYDLLLALLRRIRDDISEQSRGRRPVLIFCGDYVDRGPASSSVIEAIVRLKSNPALEVHPLKGNHEDMFMSFIARPANGRLWLKAGGAETLESYGLIAPDGNATDSDLNSKRDELLSAMPASHFKFLQNLQLIATLGDFAFVHAGVDPSAPLSKQNANDPLWIGEEFRQFRGSFGKRIIHGHSWTSSQPAVFKNRIGLDTGAYSTGALTCLCIDGAHMQFFQTDASLACRPLPSIGLS